MILYSNTMSGWMSGGRGHGWLDHHNWPFKNSIIIIMFLLFCHCSSSTSSRNCAINFIGCFNRFSIQYNLGIPSPHPLICIWWNFNAKRIPSFRLSLGRKFHFYCRILNLFFVWSRKRGEQKRTLFDLYMMLPPAPAVGLRSSRPHPSRRHQTFSLFSISRIM